MVLRHRIIVTVVTSLVCTHALELYKGCGSDHVVCIGGRSNVSSSGTSGCIGEKNCQSFVKIEKVFSNIEANGQSGEGPIFKWEMVFEHSSQHNSSHHLNTLWLVVSNKTVVLQDGKLPPLIPYWEYRKYLSKSRLDGFKVKVNQMCLLQTRPCAFEVANSQNYISFGPIQAMSYTDTKLEYIGSVGRSKQLISVTFHGKVMEYDLLQDELTVVLFHWYRNSTASATENYSGNFEPIHLFKKEKVKEEPRKQSETEPEKSKDLTWLWIVLAILLIVTIMIGIIVFYCCRKRNAAARKKKEMLAAKGKGKRLNYIAKLAGYDPGKPLSGPKRTTVKQHDFNKEFKSDQVSQV